MKYCAVTLKNPDAAEAARNELHSLMLAKHRRLDELVTRASSAGAVAGERAYQCFRECLLRHIRIEEKLLLPMAKRNRDGAPLPLAERLRLDHGALGALLMLAPLDDTFRAIRAVLDRHNPLEENEGGVYAQCTSLAGQEIDSLLAQISAAPLVAPSQWVNSARVVAAAKRVLARAGYEPSLLGP
jgi:hypothetical protein